MQWRGMYLCITTESAPACSVPHVSWKTLSQTSRVVPASEKAVVCHGATPQHVRKFLVAFWKAILRMSSTTHPPQLRNEGNWVRPGHRLVAFDHMYPAQCFPTAGEWHPPPPEYSLVPPALQLHLWYYNCGVSVYVPVQCIAQQGVGNVLSWFHSRPRLFERTQWPRFVL